MKDLLEQAKENSKKIDEAKERRDTAKDVDSYYTAYLEVKELRVKMDWLASKINCCTSST